MANIKLDRVLRSLKSYSKNELAKLASATNNEIYARETQSGDLILHFQLPGTHPLETTEVEKQKNVKRAIELEIHSGHYEDWELVQWGQAISDSRDQQHFEMLGNGLLPLYSYILRAEKLASGIADYVNRNPGKLWIDTDDKKRIFPFDETKSGDLNKAITEIGILAERLNLPVDQALPRLMALSSGIYNLINQHDKGESLRNAAAEYEGMSDSLLNWINNYKKPGADPVPVIDRLCIRARAYRDSGKTWEDTYNQIEIDLAKPKNHLEQEEYDKLHNNTFKTKDRKATIWGVDNLKKAYSTRYPATSDLMIGK